MSGAGGCGREGRLAVHCRTGCGVGVVATDAAVAAAVSVPGPEPGAVMAIAGGYQTAWHTTGQLADCDVGERGETQQHQSREDHGGGSEIGILIEMEAEVEAEDNCGSAG